MKKTAIIILLLVTVFSFSQQKKYVSYTVKYGETMKEIAKKYKVSTRDLLRLNPDIGRKPKANTVIIVPNLNFGKTAEVVKPKPVEKGIYVVKPKETWFGISKKFHITIEELKAANLLVTNLKVGTRLKIPEPKTSPLEDKLKFLTHIVAKDDTVYSLTKRYNVSEQDLVQLNPTLKEGLKLGAILKIKPLQEVVKATDSISGLEETKKTFVENFDTTKSLNVVLMFPYQINKLNDSARYSAFKKSQLLNIATDMHLGVQMAVDSLKQKGININLNYFDTENSVQKIQYIISNNTFDDTDVVIGPLFYDKAIWLSKKIKAPVVAPMFSRKQEQISSSNIVKSMPSNKLLSEALLNYLEENYNGENIVVVNDGTVTSQKTLWKTVNRIKSFDSIQTVSVIKPSILKDKKTNLIIDNDALIKKLSLTSNNWVILISDENETTASAINGLKSYQSDNFNISLFSFDKGRNFDQIDNTLLGKLNFTYSTSEFVDMTNSLVKRFFEKYQKLNHAIPSKYAIRGFDVAYDVLARIASSETFEEGMDAGVSSRLSSTFNFDKKLFGPIENKEVFLIQYNKELTPLILNQITN